MQRYAEYSVIPEKYGKFPYKYINIILRTSYVSLQGPSRNLELDCGSTMVSLLNSSCDAVQRQISVRFFFWKIDHVLQQDSSDWTKLKPEVNIADADEAPTYRSNYYKYCITQ